MLGLDAKEVIIGCKGEFSGAGCPVNKANLAASNDQDSTLPKFYNSPFLGCLDSREMEALTCDNNNRINFFSLEGAFTSFQDLLL